MGFISRKIFPACGTMCVCCPTLRSSSRKPVKRYKKLLSEIFPKSIDGPPSERKIVKLCEYAAKNPVRIPKIAKYLEERCYKELRCEHLKFINIVTETYSKLLCLCKEQMAYFAISLLNVVTELVENSKQDALQILGCQTLTRFIYGQADATYTHNIESLVCKVCSLARAKEDDRQRLSLRASSLQCISAMIWFMTEFSHIFVDLDEIVQVILDNYEADPQTDDDDERGSLIIIGWMSCMIIRRRPEKKDPSRLTREEIETPKVWAQICIQRMVELAKESTTMPYIGSNEAFSKLIMDCNYVHILSCNLLVLNPVNFVSGNQQLILTHVIRHLDRKNVSHDPQLKSYVIQVATALAREIRSGAMLPEVGFVSDLCRHLRKSLQATVESVGEQESNLNIMLQNSIEDCLLEIAKRIGNAQPLFDMMAITLEKLPSGIVARATIGSLMILAYTISQALVSSRSWQVFPESLLIQLLKVMLHPDIETRVGAHQIFSILLIPCSNRPLHEVASLHTARKEKGGSKAEKHWNNAHDAFEGTDIVEEDCKRRGHKNSPNFYKISSIIEKTYGSISLNEAEPFVMKLTEDQIAHLLSAFWIQANLPDNLPSNVEAIAHSFILTLISSRLKNPNDSVVVHFFQFLLSLRNISLDFNNGSLPSACQRSLLVLSMGMLMFAAKIYHIPDLNDFLKSLIPKDIDPYLGICDDLQVYLKPEVDVRGFGSVADNQLAASLLSDLRNKLYESENVIVDILVQNLANITKLEVEDVAKQLSGSFTPDDAFLFGPQSVLDFDNNQMVAHSSESLSFDGDFPTNSLVDDDGTSEASVADLSRFIPKTPSTSSSVPHVISIGQLFESALEVAGQVAGTSVSTSPLPFNTMASQCEALGTGTRKKLSNWLANDNRNSNSKTYSEKLYPYFLQMDEQPSIVSEYGGGASEGVQGVLRQDPWVSMRLPPASPFDNFLKAAGC
ncbi:hypothetical protein FNV43_RR04584 [Rhamnella rubrinervis]|uniref:Uncharacterized protein n=1 Tax=Rhamnella rubrinervis TaxID=2594499 RepID=A0A8K0HK15_9ROSA|nr:hypothetical protein FNV43_RR04584 [Rhamnella rubrinervis]